MFKLVENPTFCRDVTVLVPADGGHRKETCKAVFTAVSVSEAKGYDFGTEDGTRTFLERVIVSLSDIADEHGSPLSYSPDLRDRVLDRSYARTALMKSYLEGIRQELVGN